MKRATGAFAMSLLIIAGCSLGSCSLERGDGAGDAGPLSDTDGSPPCSRWGELLVLSNQRIELFQHGEKLGGAAPPTAPDSEEWVSIGPICLDWEGFQFELVVFGQTQFLALEGEEPSVLEFVFPSGESVIASWAMCTEVEGCKASPECASSGECEGSTVTVIVDP